MAPFRKITISPMGKTSTCCYFEKHNKKYSSLEEAFFSDEMNLLRKGMLSGTEYDSCNSCKIIEKYNGYSQRLALNDEYDANQYLNYEKQLVPVLQDIEFSVDNKCNFMCVTCNKRSSSRWNNLINLNSEQYIKFKKIDDFDVQEKNVNDIKLNDFKNLKYLSLTGGEPVIQKKFDEHFFEYLISNINFDDFIFSMNTNCSKFPHQKWQDFIQKVDRVMIMISLDGVGSVGEFCRDGMKMKIFDKNLKKYLKLLEKKSRLVYNNITSGVWINFVMTPFNIFNIYDTLKYLQKYHLDERIFLTNCNVPEYLNVSFLPENIKDVIYNNIIFYDSRHEKFINSILHSEKFNIKHCKDFINYTDFLKNFFDIPEESLFIYKKLKEQLHEK